jgi:broad specificity phosphatase PhoE
MRREKTDSCAGLKIALAFLTTFAFAVAAPIFGYSGNYDRAVTTVILVRHAEKMTEPNNPTPNPDPDLSPAGVARAQEIVRMFGDAEITAIYATQYKRTVQTVKPLADKLRVAITQVNSKNTADVVNQIRTKHAGEVIFVSGHNTTVPEIINGLGGPKLPIIPETEFDNLYILTIDSAGKTDLVKLRYGSAIPVPVSKPMMQP